MAEPVPPRTLPDGLVLRPATPADADAIVELSLRQHGEQEEWGLRHLLGEPHDASDWTVVVDGDRVVSTCALLRHEIELSGARTTTVLPVGRIEYVATDAAYQRRGLVRLQFEAHHRRSDTRGDLFQMVFGIPYFYRRFGYCYGLSYPTQYHVRPDQVASPSGHTFEPATEHDVESIAALHQARQAAAHLRLPWPRSDWEALVDRGRTAEPVVFVVRAGDSVRGFLRLQTYREDGMAEVVQAASVDLDAAMALAAGAVDRTEGMTLGILDQPADPLGALLRSIGHAPPGGFGAIFVRVPEPRTLVEAVLPVLSARLTASPLARDRGTLTLSLYHRSLVLRYEDGEVVGVDDAAGIEDPPETGDVGIPPDAVAPLVLGRFGAVELAERIDDVVLGRHAGIMEILFPPMTADIIDPI